MKRKRAGKTRHVVAWMNKGEWEQILDQLYCTHTALRKHALHRISAWKGRFGRTTPVAVECTASLVRCQVLDSMGKLEADDLVLLYGMALTRFVNLILERQHGRVAKPLRHLASNLNIPEWIVNLRHDMTHRRLPSLKWCRKGCAFVLKWLQQNYWSRQLSSRVGDDWNSSSSSEQEEDEEEKSRKREEEVLSRQREMEAHKRVRELLISYEREQFQVYEELVRCGLQHGPWPEPGPDLSWTLTQIKDISSDSSDMLIEVLVQDGFLIPTVEQMDSLNINTSEYQFDRLTPWLPREFLRFWLPLLKLLNSSSFTASLLEKLFWELSADAGPGAEREYYACAWIAHLLHCASPGSGSGSKDESKALRKMRMKDRILISRAWLPWQQLVTACLNSPCPATPYLLQQILSGMDKPLPPDAQHNLLRLCTIYTQSSIHDDCPHHGDGYDDDDDDDDLPGDASQPVYTLQSLQERLGGVTPNRHAHSPDHAHPAKQAPPTSEQLSAEAVMERNAALHGSPWSVCADPVQWTRYPLGKVPGQPDDPSCLMVESYCTLTVFDQQVEPDHLTHTNTTTTISVPVSSRNGSDGLLWTHSDLSKIKAGLTLF